MARNEGVVTVGNANAVRNIDEQTGSGSDDDAETLEEGPLEDITQYTIPEALKLIKSDRSQYPSSPPVPIQQCPPIQIMNNALKEENENEFRTPPTSLQNGGVGYLISDKWLYKLSQYLKHGRQEDHPGPVDNSDLFDNDGVLELRINYKILSKTQWDLLMQWFGGGVEVKKEVSKRGDLVSDVIIRVVCTNNLTEYRRVPLPGNLNLGDAKKLLCGLFGVDATKAKLYDYFNNRPHASLDEADTLVQNAHLVSDNLVLIELPRKDGSYVIRLENRYRGYTVTVDREDRMRGSAPATCGAVGIQNIGNTCYMNSTLQCLSNIPLLRQYFVNGDYKQDINRNNPLGYNGKLAEAFGGIMEKMWGNSGDILVPYGFKHVISEIKPQFAGHQQHDSQELLSCILDGLHEDLNRIHVKPATEAPLANGRPDEEVAQEALEVYKARNDSRISDLFTGLFKSTVRCPDPECGNISVTFDPYMILPLPLKGAEAAFQKIHVIFVAENDWSNITKFNLQIPKHGPVFFFRHAIAEYMKVAPSNVLVTRVKKSKIVDFLKDNDEIAEISNTDTIVAYEVQEAERAVFSSIQDDFLTSSWRRMLSYQTADDEEEYDSDDSEYSRNMELPELEDIEKASKNRANDERNHNKKDENQDSKNSDDRFIGFRGCPWVVGDIWLGNYQFEDSPQVARIEVLKVERVEDGQFNVVVAFDTKMNVSAAREKWFVQTSFQAQGVYKVRPKKEQPKKSKSNAKLKEPNRRMSSLFNLGKKKHDITPIESSKSMEDGSSFFEENLMDGMIEFEPFGEPRFHSDSPPNNYSESEEEREPVIMAGSVDLEHGRFWGSVKNSSRFLRGEFFMYRMRSRNWKSQASPLEAVKRKSMAKKKKIVTDGLLPVSEIPLTIGARADGEPPLTYYFVTLAHRKEKRSAYGSHMLEKFFLVPTVFILTDKETTEEQFYKELMKNFKKLLSNPASEKCDTEELQDAFDVIRAARGYDTKPKRTKNEMNTGEFIEVDSDDKLISGNNTEIQLVVHWKTACPFENTLKTEYLEVPNNSETMDIKYALDIFSEEEKLNSYNSWYCRKCKVHQEAYKKIEIWSLPAILVVQFKRFSQEEGRNRADKLETLVDFPVENLNLEKYVLSSESKRASKYDLVAVSCHYGALGIGHYTAFARNELNGNWYKFDDHRVYKLEGEELKSIADPSAYVIFYLRQDMRPEAWAN